MTKEYLSSLYINFRRIKQARFLLPHLQQALFQLPEEPLKPEKQEKPKRKLTVTKNGKTTLNADDHTILHCHVVLQALGCRMANSTDPKKGTIKDTAFPNLDTLCVDTQLSLSTVQRALGLLIATGFITKTYIPQSNRRRRKNEGEFAHCRYHLVPEVWDLIPYSSDGGGDVEAVRSPITAPYTAAPRSAAAIAAEEETAASLGEEVEKIDFERTSKKYESVDAIIALLKMHFGYHPTFRHPGANNIMAKIVRDCIDMAGGSGQKCLAVLQRVCLDAQYEKFRELVSQKDHLGGYIRASFMTWLQELDAAVAGASSTPEEGEYCDDYVEDVLFEMCGLEIQDFNVTTVEDASEADWLVEELQKRIDTHLLEIAVFNDGPFKKQVKYRVSDAFKAAWNLNVCTGHNVSADNLQRYGELAHLAAFARVDQDHWRPLMEDAEDVETWFLEHRHEIADDYQHRNGVHLEQEDDADPDY